MSRMQQQEASVATQLSGRSSHDTRHLFHHGHDLVACIDGRERHRVLRVVAGALGQLTSGLAGPGASLYVIDRSSSVLGVQPSEQIRPLAYTAYGYAHDLNVSSLTGFNGAYPDIDSWQYPLGAGNRFYSPTLMRFSSPDSFSPFGVGGLNIYTYCEGDPVNRIDPSANSAVPILSKSKFPGLYGFLESEQGKQFRLFGRKDFDDVHGIQRFKLKIENGQQEYQLDAYKKATLPMYVSEDGKTSFTVLMFEKENGPNRSSLLTYDDEFRQQGFSLQAPGKTFFLAHTLNGDMRIQKVERFSAITLDQAYSTISHHVTPQRKSWLAPMIDRQAQQVRSGGSLR